MTKTVLPKKNAEYVPPSQDTLDEVARNVCRKLAESDPSFNEPDVVYGFAALLSAVAKMHANSLNKRGQSVDQMFLDKDH